MKLKVWGEKPKPPPEPTLSRDSLLVAVAMVAAGHSVEAAWDVAELAAKMFAGRTIEAVALRSDLQALSDAIHRG